MTGDPNAPEGHEAGRAGGSNPRGDARTGDNVEGHDPGSRRRRKTGRRSINPEFHQLFLDSLMSGGFDFSDPESLQRVMFKFRDGIKKKNRLERGSQRTVSTAPTQSPYQYAITGKIAGPNTKKPGAVGG